SRAVLGTHRISPRSASELMNVQNETLRTGAETYSSAIAEAYNYMNWLMDQFKPYLHGQILEVGIGHGSYCPLLIACGKYFGIDHDTTRVAEARLRFPGAEFAPCDILVRSQLKAIFPDGVDAAVS